ncbi:hypothetical protein TPHA_0F00780 [Tetrapisispora phaffii CBS 4417]|uniref:Zn(2)-C6 fungal-type domain-containing protein n=1 Tax=Tetrapisispora phaffii (strain ATCC 24235 / CBS 4417 / NBRC 1672 / NRRL Y-8282 / UCD 70-5) TaxID=1071381 RepID=G8BUY2_TETPH|nr:hypothetical protein TPHA_0F00780 [Tetrapisispora phaffii CBS 4417]CCE63564.1 hypothetical protein TPHA_0F00780 [Tetrapisispora phaffii CBS 4417]
MGNKRIIRKRIIKSCKFCYIHKIKCDRQLPCSNCATKVDVDPCKYGFDKDDLIAESDNESNYSDYNNTKIKKLKGSIKKEIVFKPKYYNPFFSTLINNTLLSIESFDELIDKQNFQRNVVVNFDRFKPYKLKYDEIIDLIPNNKDDAEFKLRRFYESINPIIPIVSRVCITKIVNEIYLNRKDNKEVNPSSLILLIAMFFCELFADVAAKLKSDISTCNKYFSAFRFLLDVINFPMKSSMECIQACVLVNFVIDPNMIHFTGYSTMLIRLAQQNGINKIAKEMKYQNDSIKILWNFLLYIEGSSSVTFGLPFFSSCELLDFAPLTITDIANNNSEYPLEYTYGRFIINRIFKDLMKIISLNSVSKQHLSLIKRKIDGLYNEINFLNLNIRSKYPVHPEYFTSTLFIFLYRLHLRYIALYTLRAQNDEIIEPLNNGQLALNMEHLLESEAIFNDEVITLSLLLLLHTMKRLVQKDIEKFVWYTRGSTIMQYLFIVLKDIYQKPQKPYMLSNFPEITREIMDQDLKVIIDTDPILFKYVLVEDILKLVEMQLVSLWSNDDLYKFIIIKSVKEEVWKKHESFLMHSKKELESIRECNMFASCNKYLNLDKDIELLDSMDHLKENVTSTEISKILQEWVSEFNDRRQDS